MHNQAINIDPEIMHGTPVFMGTRVPIKMLFEYLEDGDTVDDFINDFDWVTKEQALQVVALSGKALLQILPVLDENFAR